jgi:hypothetical protein
MSAETAQRTVEKHVYGVAAVEVGGRQLALAWGRLVIIGGDFASAPSSLGSWTMDLETISYGKLPMSDCAVRITIRDGRTMVAEAVLESTNGRLFRFKSRTASTGLDHLETAIEERHDQPTSADSLN